MQAIETCFAGYRFRSRLEARYAVLFRTCGWRFEYEREGFQLEPGRFLPDFYLPDWPTWIEIKGINPDPHNVDLCRSLNLDTGEDVILIVGDPGWERRVTRFRQGVGSELYLWELLAYHDFGRSDIDNVFDAARGARFEH